MEKLSETMKRGLLEMATRIERAPMGATFAYPNENTAYALERRGLIKGAKPGVFRKCYTLTGKGKVVVEHLRNA